MCIKSVCARVYIYIYKNEIICNLISTLFLFIFLLFIFYFYLYFLIFFLSFYFFKNFIYLFIYFFLYLIFWIRTVTPHSLLCDSSEACKDSTDETESITIIFSTEINLLWRLNRVWVSMKLYYIYIYIIEIKEIKNQFSSICLVLFIHLFFFYLYSFDGAFSIILIKKITNFICIFHIV